MIGWAGFGDYRRARDAEAASARIDGDFARAELREAERNKGKLSPREQEKLKAKIKATLRQIKRQQEEERAQWLADYEAREWAKRELEMHAQELADEIRHARELRGPNPWLQPGDPEYVSPEVAEARRLAGDPDPYRRGT